MKIKNDKKNEVKNGKSIISYSSMLLWIHSVPKKWKIRTPYTGAEKKVRN